MAIRDCRRLKPEPGPPVAGPTMTVDEARELAAEHGLAVSDFAWVHPPCSYISDYHFGHGRICTVCGERALPRLKADTAERLRNESNAKGVER